MVKFGLEMMDYLRSFFPWVFGPRSDVHDPSTSSAPVIDPFYFRLSNGLQVTFTNESIAEVEADVVVVGNDRGLTNDGNAAKALMSVGGEQYRRAWKEMKGRAKRERGRKVLCCNAGPNLSCRKVYHAIVEGKYASRWGQGSWRGNLDQLYRAICSMASREDVRVTSLAAVLVGAGKAGGPTADSVRAALAAFSSLPASGTSSLQRLLLVERDERKSREAIQECRKWAREHPPAPQQQPPAPQQQPPAPQQQPPAPQQQPPAPPEHPPDPQPSQQASPSAGGPAPQTAADSVTRGSAPPQDSPQHLAGGGEGQIVTSGGDDASGRQEAGEADDVREVTSPGPEELQRGDVIRRSTRGQRKQFAED